ncbi:MAG: VWA-like domain-containing protein [Vulcanimicrobiota bacterium]
MKAEERMRSVVERWFLIEPLLFAAWTTHSLHFDARRSNIRVNRGRIEANPSFIDSLNPRQLDEVMRCEATRILLKHPYLRRRESPTIAHLASNVTLQEYLRTGLPLPYAKDLFGSDAFDRRFFEFYYQKLAEEGGGFSGDAGSVLEAYADSRIGGTENTEGWDSDDFLAIRINDQIRTALETGNWGTLAGEVRERILATLWPGLDYRAVLAQFRASILSKKRVLTRMKPSRRYGFLQLGSRYELATRLLVAVDVSGSMSSKDLARGFSLINQFFRHNVLGIDVVSFDTIVQGRPLRLTKACLQFDIRGRGGTDFTPVMELLDERPNYDGLLIFTDGQAPVPPLPRNRRTRILWIFNSHSSYRQMHNQLRHIGRAVYRKEA